jgi:hypothetical protein
MAATAAPARPGARVGQVQAVLVEQHGLVLEPGGPGLLADALEDLLAELARVGREVQALGFLAQFDALNHSCHGQLLVICVLRWGFVMCLGLYRSEQTVRSLLRRNAA